ncbi:MAG: STY4851/ECs_5259 family protein [Deltaproteobacteria bacterium]|nr:STY4851/ECs_5259 family protein [Deltaproteobacteria bacterium]
MQAEEWVHAFALKQGGWSALRKAARPLYALRCDRSGFEELRSSLRRTFSRTAIANASGADCAAIVLFAAEWWRRCYQGGGWAWRLAYEAFGATCPPYNVTVDVVERGLALFGRSVHEVNGISQRLGTIIAEGGLPLFAIDRDSSNLRQFFQSVLEELGSLGVAGESVERAVSRYSDLLPVSLPREETQQLCADLASSLYSLQQALPRDADPIAWLEQHRPDWQSSLPLLLEEESAKVLLRNLVSDARRAVERGRTHLRFSLTLARADDGAFAVERRLDARWIAQNDLARAFGAELATMPARMKLFCQPEDGEPVQLCIAAAERRGNEVVYRLETPRSGPVLVSGPSDLRLGALGLGSRLLEPAFIRGSSLGDLPWVFGELEGEAPGRLLATGSAYLGDPSALVALDERSFRWIEDRPEEVGSVIGCTRKLFRVTGRSQCLAIDGEARCTIATRQAVSTRHTSWPQGRHPPGIVGRHPTFAGFPTLMVDDGSSVREAPRTSLRWRPKGTQVPWRGVRDFEPLGDVRVQMIDREELVAEHLWTIVPPEVQIVAVPGANELECTLQLEGMGTATAVIEDARVIGTRLGRGIHVQAREAGLADVAMRIEFSQNRRAHIRVPFAAVGCRIVDRSGARCTERQLVSSSELATLMVRGYGFHKRDRLEVRCKLADGIPLELNQSLTFDARRNVWELPLREIEADVALLLSLARDIDARVEVCAGPLDDPARRSTRLLVASYGLEITRDDDRNAAAIASTSASTLSEAAKARLTAWMIPMATLEGERRKLERLGDELAWKVDVASLNPGPWLLYVLDGERCAARPLRWYIPPREGEPAAPSLDPLQSAVEIPEREARQQALRDALLALQPGTSPGTWKFLESALEQLKYLPADTFDVLSTVARCDTTLVAALMRRSDSARLRLIWKGFERLPFLWETVSLSAWTQAANPTAAVQRTKYEQLGEDVPELLEGHFRHLRAHLREQEGFQTVLEVLHEAEPTIFPRLGAEHVLELPRMADEVRRKQKLEEARFGLQAAWYMLTTRHRGDDVLEEVWPQVSTSVSGDRDIERLAGFLTRSPLPWMGCFDDIIRSHGRPFQRDVAYAPLVAAYIATHRRVGDEIPIRVMGDLKRFKNFDPEWFGQAWRFFTALFAHQSPHMA